MDSHYKSMDTILFLKDYDVHTLNIIVQQKKLSSITFNIQIPRYAKNQPLFSTYLPHTMLTIGYLFQCLLFKNAHSLMNQQTLFQFLFYSHVPICFSQVLVCAFNLWRVNYLVEDLLITHRECYNGITTRHYHYMKL